MKSKILFLIFSAVFLYGCTSPLEKSVLEPMTSGQLDRVAGKDNSFLATYSIVEEKSNYIHSPQDSSRWRPITYNRLHSYLKTIESAELNSPLFSQLREKWEKMYNSYNIQIDSIIKYWKHYLEINNPDSLLKISFEGIEVERFRNLDKQIDTLLKAGLKFKALKFPVDSFNITYYFEPYSDSLCINNIMHKRKIKDSSLVKVFPNLVPELEKSLVQNDTALMFRYHINSLFSGGKCFNRDSLESELPKTVLQMIYAERDADGSQIFDEQYFREQIIRELIDPAFISQSAYIKINAEDYYKQLDSLVFSYTGLH